MKKAKKIGITIGIEVAGVVIALFVFGLVPGTHQSLIPIQHTLVIVNSMVRVEPGQYGYYTFTVPSDASNAMVSGTFAAGGGSGNDIKVAILDEQNFINYRNGHQVNAYYSSDQKTIGNISAKVPSGQTLYLVYDNTFSTVSSKEITTNVSVTYTS